MRNFIKRLDESDWIAVAIAAVIVGGLAWRYVL